MKYESPTNLKSVESNPDLIESLKAENELLKQALQDAVDYHHYIGNDDCKITINESFTYLYKNAKDALLKTKSWQYGI